MKNRSAHKLIAVLLAFVMAFSTLFTAGITNVFAAGGTETLPTSLEAPSIILYDDSDYHTSLVVKTRTPISVLDFYEKAETHSYEDENYNRYSDFGEWSYDYYSGIQIDWKIDNGSWQYQTEWNESVYNSGDYAYDLYSGQPVKEVGIGSSWYGYKQGIVEQLDTLGCLTSTTDGEDVFYRFDAANHQITVRARYVFRVTDNDGGERIILSSWSTEATYGKGSRVDSTAPGSLSAPVLANLEIYDTNGDKSPATSFDVLHTADILAAMHWSEQYDSALEYSHIRLDLEVSLDPNFGPDATIVTNWSNIPERHLTWDYMIKDLWWELPDREGDAFYWEGETVYLRAKWVNDRTVSDHDSSIQSPYSNVLSVVGPNVGRYNVTVTHGSYGFDALKYYSESYKITDGREYDEICCAPLEGCYVDTITVNDVVMYDHDIPDTHDLLEHNSYNDRFWFKEADITADKNLNIVITYAGTPTAKYGITTECGTGGYLTTSASYDSWDDNSLVVFHGTAPEMTVHTHAGYEIDKVMIDGVENAQAKADGSYTFPAITDNTHSISVTFKRVAYEVDSYAYHGTIHTDYAGYDVDDYVKIGDDITFTFAPAQDDSGNYYEIESVYIDDVLNEQAKNAGTYTFTNVQAEHSIRVYYSDDPVITHDVTATSGANGQISPEGTVHVREGSTQRFDFYPDAGYEVDKVTVDGVEITNLASKEYYNVANVTTDRTIHVTFKKIPVQYTVNVTVSGNNPSVHTVNPKGATPVWEGEGFTVNYSPFAGYEVEKVLVNGSEVEANGSYAIASVNSNYNIEIYFKIKSFHVTFVDYDGTVLKTEMVEHGSTATAPKDPTREHYVFNGWDVNFSNITSAVTVKATYVPAKYTVRFIGWDGTTLKTEQVEYTNDATAPTPPIREGYDFDKWSRGYTNVGSDLEVTAVYVQKQYTVTFVDSDNTVISTQTVKHGEPATVPENPFKTGYTFIGWDNTNYGCVTQNMTIKAKYVEDVGTTYTVTARALGNAGTVSPIGATTVLENGSLTVQFTPSSLSEIVKVVVDGTEIAVCSSYTFDNITANHTVDVYFAPTAVINVGNGGDAESGSAAGHYELIDGTMAYILDVTPADGYELDGIYINGAPAENLEPYGNGYIIRDLSGDMDIDVRFKPISGNEGNDGNTGDGDNDGDNTGDGDNDGQNPPQTGDAGNLPLWMALLFVSGMALAGTAVYSRKRRYNK